MRVTKPCEIITTPDRLPDTMYLAWGGDTLDAGGGNEAKNRKCNMSPTARDEQEKSSAHRPRLAPIRGCATH